MVLTVMEELVFVELGGSLHVGLLGFESRSLQRRWLCKSKLQLLKEELMSEQPCQSGWTF